MTHFVANLAFRLLFVLAFLVFGFLAETFSTLDDAENEKGLLLNCLNTVVFHAFDLTLGGLTAFYVTVLAHKIAFHGVIQMHAGESFVRAFVLSLLAIATADFFYYWLHRLQHSSKWLWAEHELHHSDEHVNVTTAWRHHWLDSVLIPAFALFPTAVIFNPPSGTMLSLFLFAKGMVYFVHLNSRIRFGIFNRVLTSPQMHRIHHSKSPLHMDKNFATIFPLWDVLFGTYYHPNEQEWPATGVEGVRVTSLWRAVVMPFPAWRDMLLRTPKIAAAELPTAN